jgi:4-diphosphocytidyl-2-C-methyl-D-erythritol kinase
LILHDTGFAKLNLALHVRGKLPGGRHALETIFAFCEDGDELSAEAADDLSLEIHGPFAPALASDRSNLVLSAAEAIRVAAGIVAGARFRLCKTLPVASGIGGGSADAAAALRLLTRLWGLDPALAEQVAPTLGSDVPACLRSTSCRGTGGGEALEPVDLGLEGKPVLLVNPLVPLGTGQVFGRWHGLDRGPLLDWRNGRNDLEPAAITLVPVIADVLDWLRGCPGAEFVRMSGSGATCFALFADIKTKDAAAACVPAGWWHLATRLR